MLSSPAVPTDVPGASALGLCVQAAPATQHPWAWICVLPRAGKGLSQPKWTQLWPFSTPLVPEMHIALLPSWLVPHSCAVGRREREAPGPFPPGKQELGVGAGSRNPARPSPALNTPQGSRPWAVLAGSGLGASQGPAVCQGQADTTGTGSPSRAVLFVRRLQRLLGCFCLHQCPKGLGFMAVVQ